MASRSSSLGSLPLILFIGSIFLFMGLRAAASYAAARFSIGAIKARIHSIDLSGVLIKITMAIRNDSGIAIPVESFEGVLKYGESILAPINLSNPMTIQTGTETIVPLDARINYSNLADNVKSLIMSGNYLSQLSISGRVTAGGITVPFTKNLIAIG